MFFSYFIMYLITSYVLYTIYRKANIRTAFLAWIPFIGFIPHFHVINRSAWNILWFIIPVANIIAGIIFAIEFLQAFGLSPWLVLICWVPFVIPIIYLYIAVADVEYQIPYNSYAV